MSSQTETSGRARRGPEPPDISEKGGPKNGQPQRSDERLFMQLMAFGGCADTGPLADALAAAGVTAVLYEDVNDPRGIAVPKRCPHRGFPFRVDITFTDGTHQTATSAVPCPR